MNYDIDVYIQKIKNYWSHREKKNISVESQVFQIYKYEYYYNKKKL